MTLLEDARSIADEPTRLHHPPQRCSAVATQIKVAHRLHNMRTIRYPAPTGQLRKAIHSALGAAARLLPITCRKRWIQEWDGELHAAETLTGRLRYTLDVLTGLPTMAIIPRARSQL